MLNTNTNILIKDVTFDIISVITIWGFFSNSNINIRFNNKIYPVYTNIICFSISTYFLKKYF